MLWSKMVKFVSDGAGAGGGDGPDDEPSWHEFLMVPATRRVGQPFFNNNPLTVDDILRLCWCLPCVRGKQSFKTSLILKTGRGW
jgi:hypothetical protein